MYKAWFFCVELKVEVCAGVARFEIFGWVLGLGMGDGGWGRIWAWVKYWSLGRVVGKGGWKMGGVGGVDGRW